jgi:hypothetical protein
MGTHIFVDTHGVIGTHRVVLITHPMGTHWEYFFLAHVL